jgi:hypothetical protein
LLREIPRKRHVRPSPGDLLMMVEDPQACLDAPELLGLIPDLLSWAIRTIA